MKFLRTLINIYLQKLWNFIGYLLEKPQFKASMIQSDAGVYSTNHENVDCDRIFQDQKQIDTLHINDLYYIEKDLDFYEKVALLFLLYGGTKIDAQFALQKLLIGVRNETQQDTSYLQEWATNQPADNKWKSILVEGLSIIHANNVLRKIGLDPKNIYEICLPNTPDTSLLIHPILKVLYFMCEQLTPTETEEFIEHIKIRNERAREIPYVNGKYLEIFLLHLIDERIISVGDWNANGVKVSFCDIKAVADFPKAFDKDYLKDTLKNASTKFNFTRENVIRNEKEKSYLMTTDNIGENNKTNTKATSNQNNLPNHSKSPLINDFDEEEKYLIKKETAGVLLIINQEKFKDKNKQLAPKLENRHGTEKDKKAISETFAAFGYKIIEKNDLNKKEILSEVSRAVKKSKDKDSLIVCILSHGNEGVIYDSDSFPVPICDIKNLMATPELLRKPKIVIIQACQGNKVQQLEHVYSKPKLQADGPGMSVAPLYCDFCVAHSTIPGYTSYREPSTGSWFIQILCANMKLASSKHFLDILTKVCYDVSKKLGDGYECMVPSTESSLSKNVYFPV